MTDLRLPALDGRTPLGFLAGLGLLRLVTEHTGHTARISWDTETCTAVLSDAHASIDDLVADLQRVVDVIPADGVLPGLAPDLPPPGEAPDKMRLPRPDLRDFGEQVWRNGGRDGERWMSSLVTDLSLDERGRADISLFAAPSGKQSMRTMLEKPLAIVRDQPHVLHEALTGWRRYPGVTGEYLDHRVLFDGADAPDGKSLERGVPGATWLALMSYPLLRTTASGREPVTTLWQQDGRSAASRRMIYPLWSQSLDVDTVICLLQHPILKGADPGPPPDTARLLSIFMICAAERRRIPGRTFAGVLTPTSGVRSPKRGRRSRGPSR